MVLILLPLSLNILTGIAVWAGGLPLLPKLVLTAILVVKFGGYFYTVIIDAADHSRFVGLVTCAVLNVLLICYFAWKAIWIAIPGCAVLAVLAIAWGAISGFSFKKED